MPKKSIDDKIDDLALAVGHGLEEIRDSMRDGFAVLNVRLDGIGDRLDRIEFLVTGQERRLTIVEDRIRQLATKTGLDFTRP